MTFDEVLEQMRELLASKGRVTYRALKVRFGVDDEYLAACKEELIEAERVAVDENGKVLVWVGAAPGAKFQVPGQDAQPRTAHSALFPVSYTPPHLAERIRAEQAAMEAKGVTDGERKTITALFADIQDSTTLIEDLDPEAARCLIDPALQVMMDAVHRYEGFVVQPTGDGIFALFGAPLAHEDHPQRALFAALLMQADSKRYAEQLRREQGRNLQIRVGVNTGEVVLRSIRKDDLHTDYTPVGHSIHLAARLESLASGGAVVVSEGTYKLIEGYFECKSLGAAKVKGVTEPIAIYEVIGVGPLRTRLQVSARRGLTRFVGRQSELEHLRRALTQATAGHGQIVGVMGEPGLGKSRLFHEFKLTAPSGGLVLEAYSVSYGKASSYLPVIELLTTLPDTGAHVHQELILHLSLGLPLQATRGFSSPDVGATYTRARELCQQAGDTRQLFSALFGLRTFHHVGGEFLPARELGEQLLSLAQREDDPALLMEAYRAVGSTLFPLGELGAAQAYLEQGLTLYDAQRHRSQVFLYGGGIEPGIFGLIYAALVLWHLGYPDQALQKSAAARTLGQELSYPYSLASARIYAAMLHHLRRERSLIQEWAEAGISLAREHGIPQSQGEGAILQGWARAEQGQSEEGISQIRHGLATRQAIGAGLFQSYYLALLAEACGTAGQAEDGLAALAEALTAVDNSGERFYEAELYRLKGELTLQQFNVQGSTFKVTNPQAQAEAEACFLKAIEIARHQQAKSLELRAVMSLSRLWQSQGKRDEAHQLLAEIYRWFTEGFDTKDLQEAKALLEEWA